MFLPLYDANPLRVIAFQRTTTALIVLCTLVFLYQNPSAGIEGRAFVVAYGMVPAVLFGHAELASELARVPAGATLLTTLFLHGDLPHLLGNMLFLWVFGDNVEEAMGHLRFLAFYLLCGVLAALAHGLADPYSIKPLIGASGAVAGVMGAYVMLHPRVRILILVVGRLPLYLPAYLILGAWLLFQLVMPMAAGDGHAVAWWAHVAGFMAGAVLVITFRRSGVVLFDRGVPH
ncbi:MAG: rhomboid family intramembrane serine protease [Gammaproteobacteria bacterium]|nr:rhomboid family intramembrane serine protease [Gammaproteobacteria bacterium]